MFADYTIGFFAIRPEAYKKVEPLFAKAAEAMENFDPNCTDAADVAFQEARARAAEAQNLHEEGNALKSLSVVYREMGLLDPAMEKAEEALALLGELENPELAADCYNNLAALHGVQGDHTAALELYRRALDLYRESGPSEDLVAGHGNLGHTLAALGRLQFYFQRRLGGLLLTVLTGRHGHVFLKLM